jgi:hypothetical protein
LRLQLEPDAACQRRLWLRAARACGRAPGLARPFDDRLFFAGEETLRFDFSTAHGAYDSGVRAAEQAVASFAVVR